MYTVYAIKSLTKNYIYVGQTNNLKGRLKRHNSGYEKTTRSYRPFKLIYKEEHRTRKKAREREKYLNQELAKSFSKVY